MINYIEAKERERLLKKLEPRYKSAKLIYLSKHITVNGWYFDSDYYLIVESIELKDITGFDLMIITLNPKSPTWNVAMQSLESVISKFSSWFIYEAHLRYMERYLKPISSFLYHKC